MDVVALHREAAPRFSIVTPVYETPARVLARMLRSVQRQSFRGWELCLVDDGSREPHVAEALAGAAQGDARIRLHRREANGGIVVASNDALAMAQGEFVVLLDHDDELHPDALAHVHEALLENPDADYVYTDEDKIVGPGLHLRPFFKPDWSPERLRTQMYTCHLSALRRSLVEEVGGFDPEFEGSQDWDLVLKVTERARAVLHVPLVLYHWRVIATSAAVGGVAAKPWAFEAGARAVQAHCERVGLQARAERDETHTGVYRLEPELESEPRVSIVIPTACQVREVRYRPQVLVNNCVRGIRERSSYGNYEIVCVVDATAPTDAVAELRELGGERLRIVFYDQPFDFSAKVNLGAAHAEGEHLLLLNDDIEVATPKWIERMVMYSSLPGVGAVGGRLLLEDGRIQHAGVRFKHGLPGHPYYGYAGDFEGYVNEILVARNPLAVTGACLMTRRNLFDRLGGLSGEFPVNYNDVDYCLKLRRDGRRVVYDPDLVMFHFESSSRSPDVADWEKRLLRQKWPQLSAVDPDSNPNLLQEGPKLCARLNFALRRAPRLRPR